jgi:hypothetical protein
MSWKVTALQSLILLGLSYLAVQYFSLTPLKEVQSQQNSAATEIAGIKKRLESIDQRISELINTENEGMINLAMQQAPQKNEQEAVLYQRITALEQREKDLTEKIASLAAQQEELFQVQEPPEQVKVHGWLTTLSDEKKSMVQEIYQEQLSLMQNNISTSPDQLPPSSEEMLSILEENRSELKTRLQEILTDEEYTAFLETLNKTQHPPGLPPIAPKF